MSPPSAAGPQFLHRESYPATPLTNGERYELAFHIRGTVGPSVERPHPPPHRGATSGTSRTFGYPILCAMLRHTHVRSARAPPHARSTQPQALPATASLAADHVRPRSRIRERRNPPESI